MNLGAVSFAQIVKAAEPAFAALIGTTLYGKSVSMAKWLCLIPVIGGVCLASMKAIIQKTGFDVANRLDVCINGIEMVNLVCNSWAIGINYKLIFTDFSMPSMDGIEAVDLIRQFFRESNVPLESQPHIIGVTGHVHNDYTKLGLQAGMN